MEINLTDSVTVMTLQVPVGPQVLTVSVPGVQGPPGDAGSGAGMPAGGTANQVIYKIDATDYNTGWKTLAKADVGLSNVDNTSDANKPVSTAQQTALNLKANLASPTFTGTVAGITKSMVGLGNVDNTADTAKPVSTAQQTALDLKANLASPTFTGTVGGITKSMVGLGNVDNTSDASKPVSTATQTALDAKAARTLTKNSVSTSYTLVAGDVTDVIIHSTAAGAINITVPQDSAATIAQEIAIPWRQYGAGQLTFVAGTGATLISRGSVFKSAGQYAEGVLTKVAANTWLLSGDIVA